MTARFAMLTNDRQIAIVNDNGVCKNISGPPKTTLMWGNWQMGQGQQVCFSWPSWSRDAKRIASFRLPEDEESSTRVFVFGADGVSANLVATLQEAVPIYLYWSPDDSKLAVLTQKSSLLTLTAAFTDGRQPYELASGSPLFFTWTDSRTIATYPGGSKQGASQVLLLDTEAQGPQIVLPGKPGNFCAPLFLDNEVFYVTHERDGWFLVSAARDSAEVRPYEPVASLVALIASPCGGKIARGFATGGDGTPYDDLSILDLKTRHSKRITKRRSLAFFWSPCGQAIILATVDTTRNLLAWYRIGLDGDEQHLADMHPTRDLTFYLRFFEQYSQSHALVDPDGKYLLLAGRLHAEHKKGQTPVLYRVPLDGGTPEQVGEGVFAVYAPR